MRYPKEVIEAIKDRCDITELIGSYVQLRRAGSNYNGLCPFHSEKTGSFTVFPDSQSFFCFGCEAGGDAFTFVMKTENLDYPGAVEFLARRAGVNLPASSEEQRKGLSRKRVYEMNLIAARFFRECLFDPSLGRAGMAYLQEKRGLSVPVIKRFGLGYAPNEFGALTNILKRAGYSYEEMKEAFLCGSSQKNGKTYTFDYFRDRIMFPIIDTTGNVIAFSGRDVGGESKAKYLNSSDTPGFQKRKNLFALNFAKNHCEEELILCEGNMDVVALHAAGFENAVASLGTALTDDQARVMAKYTKRVVIAYDSDAAGRRATGRAMDIFAKVGLDVKVLNMSGAKDPDEFIKTHGAEAFARLLKQSSTGFEFKVATVLSKYDVTIPEMKIKAAAELCDIISRVYAAAEREVYISAVAERLNLSVDSLKGDVERMRRRHAKEGKQQVTKQAQLSAMGLGDKINPEAAGSVQAVAAEETILGLLLLYGEHRAAVKKGIVSLSADDFVTGFNRRVFEAVMSLEMGDGGFEFALLGYVFSAEEMGRLTKLERDRRAMSDNGTSVLRAAIDTLKDQKHKKAVSETSGIDGIRMILDRKRSKQPRGDEPSGQ